MKNHAEFRMERSRGQGDGLYSGAGESARRSSSCGQGLTQHRPGCLRDRSGWTLLKTRIPKLRTTCCSWLSAPHHTCTIWVCQTPLFFLSFSKLMLSSSLRPHSRSTGGLGDGLVASPSRTFARRDCLGCCDLCHGHPMEGANAVDILLALTCRENC